MYEPKLTSDQLMMIRGLIREAAKATCRDPRLELYWPREKLVELARTLNEAQREANERQTV